MAKKWIPSQKQLSLYDELLRRQNITRKRLLKIRRITESEASSYGGGLPDLVIPKKARRYRDLTRYRFDSYREYRLAMAKLKAEFSDFELSFGKQHYFTNYKNVLLSMISEILDRENIPYREDAQTGKIKPERLGRFSKEEIESYTDKHPELARYFELFNKVSNMYVPKFLTMYFSGDIPVLKYVYLEMEGTLSRYNQIDEFYFKFKDFNRDVIQGNVMKTNLLDFISSRKRITSKEAQTVTKAIWKNGRKK